MKCLESNLEKILQPASAASPGAAMAVEEAPVTQLVTEDPPLIEAAMPVLSEPTGSINLGRAGLEIVMIEN